MSKPTIKSAQEQEDFAKPKNKTQLANERLQLENQRLEFQNRQLNWDGRLRLTAAFLVFFVVIGWLLAVLAIVLLQSCPRFVKLSDTALVALLVTTTANVVLLLHTVVRYLFPRANSGDR